MIPPHCHHAVSLIALKYVLAYSIVVAILVAGVWLQDIWDRRHGR